MHIPENYLSPTTCAVIAVAMVPVWKYSITKIKEEIPKEKMPLLGIGAAFSFLGMMFNIPLPGGTTGHAVGGTLIAILTGSPAAGCISVSMALLIQALLFGDGGILAFGANCFNMAFALPFLGYYVYSFLLEKTSKRKLSAAVGAYLGINMASLLAAIEFGIQPLLFKDAAGNALYCPYPLSVSIPSMMIGHLTLFGLAEIVMTVAVLAFVEKVSPDAIEEKKPASKAFKPLYILIGALILLTPLGLLATGTAWGEWGVDEIASIVSGGSKLGYTPAGMEGGFELSTLFPDYAMGGLPEWTGYILSAVVGVALTIIIFKLISATMKEKVDFAVSQ
ncbi:cobalt/nickel transport system permease protein [Acetitomaculum ruminis DSM 5522]|uniref:Cobalt/nickel transport system permease protein n=1 Tax=Acetitomaculum ruminis DSM 5522 TaxID=1120918 RepID=A0A1I1A1E5_9FIRM|nr:cobalt transporter CbiM [Acetitomaculum ruminis]SFB31765.1 cobalt/nickel transport system permease protein [Acetitomaculum ruminis DSM 5522]